MKDNTRTLIMLGVMAVLGLMFAFASIALLQMHTITERMGDLVEVRNAKIAAANKMRDAIRSRADSLRKMRLTQDPFERDEEYQHFLAHAGNYRAATERLAGLGVTPQEAGIHERLQQLTRQAQTASDAAALLLESGADGDIEAAMRDAVSLQAGMLEQLDALVELEEAASGQSLADSRVHYQRSRNLLIILTGVILLFCYLLARLISRYVASKNRQLNYQSSHDALTGLINRREFEKRVERAIRSAQSLPAAHTLMYLDLDQFKVINDVCGHGAGDLLLQHLAGLLRGTVRHRDTLGRLGGDEFGLLLENCPLDKAVGIAGKLLKSIEEYHFTWQDNTFTLSISIGVVPLDETTTDIASAMSAADAACYIAKEAGRNQIQVAYLGDRQLQQRRSEMQWVARLTRALEQNQFKLYYMPIISCAEGNGSSRQIELLLRMIDDDGSVISPRLFLPAAEKYNLATAIDRWVIDHALQWLAEHSYDHNWPITISINLSAPTLASHDMLRYIIERAEQTGAPPERIIFEITENAAIANLTEATGFMLTLRGRGFRFTLDDFGSGLSSFVFLKKLPVDFLKIDGAYVRDILSDPVDYALVRSINELAHLLDKQTIAERVETMSVANELRELGVNYLQGYAYAGPEPLSCFTYTQKPRLVVVAR
ncbi:MAG: EAL domain-containing protein [Pseudomonadota bacterium]